MDSIEITILKNLIHNDEYSRKVIPFIDKEYFEELHEKIINVNAKLGKNIAQIGEFKEPDDTFNEVSEQRQGVKSIKIEFYDLPDPLFPDK